MKPLIKVSLSTVTDGIPVHVHLCTVDESVRGARVICSEHVIAEADRDDTFAETAKDALESAAYRIRCDVAVGTAIRSAVERRPALKPFLMSLLDMIAEELPPEEKASLDWYKNFK